jgi:glycosyltransferase involved in cell wall biosynthesis
VYGISKGHSSFGRISAGAQLGFDKLERGAGFVPLDDLERATAAGIESPCGILLGPPGFAATMTSYGEHRRTFAVLAPNSEWLPKDVVERLDAHAQVVAPSEWGARVVERYTGRYTPPFQHGVDPRFRPVEAGTKILTGLYDKGYFRVLHFSSTDRQRKGTQQLLEAWLQLMSDGLLPSSSVLSAVVDAPSGTFGRAEEESSIELVNRHLNMDESRMAALYRSYHVVCQPSRAEGFGLCPLEARACGTVVCATLCTGHADHLKMGDPGVVWVAHGLKTPIDDSFSPESIAPSVKTEDVAKALKYSYENWRRLHAEAQEAAPAVAERWSWPAVTRRWLEEMGLWE